MGKLPETERWSIGKGDYIRSYEKHHLDIKALRKKEKVKKRIITIIVLVLAFAVEFLVLRMAAKI